MNKEQAILASWAKNVGPWVDAVDGNSIASRRLVTNRAIVDVLAALPGRTLLDVGCGEGWLARDMSRRGRAVTGIDAIPAFIDRARRFEGDAEFRCVEYTQLSGVAVGGRFDTAVCNFSLIGKDSVAAVFAAMPALLNPGGYLVVQTLHPDSIAGGASDGWRAGSWEGFDDAFTDPAPWYCRTRDSWCGLFTDNGMRVERVLEPRHPDSGQCLSLIVVGRSD